MSFFKDLKEDIAQSVNELTETLDESIATPEVAEISEDVNTVEVLCDLE